MTTDNNARPAANGTGAQQADRPDLKVSDWAEVYESAEEWVEWTARRRWPDFPVNDQIWACSVASWELYGKAA